MKSPILSALVFSSALLTQAQDAAAPAAAPASAAPQLTADQVKNVLQQLKDMEEVIAKQRGDNLSAILQKLRSGASSDAAALALWKECEELVNVERKELTRDEERRREDQAKRQAERNKETKDEEEGDFGAAVRLQLEYLVLTLEAHEVKDREKMLPKLGAYISNLVSSADKLKGRAGAYINRSLADNNNPFVKAFVLDRYLQTENWSMQPADFREIWEKIVLPVYREKKKADLGAQWDARISNESAFRNGSMSKAEFAIWTQHDLPSIKWERAKDLASNSDKPVNGMADMLKVIKDTPGHPDSPKWLNELRGMISAAAKANNVEVPIGLGVPAGQQ